MMSAPKVIWNIKRSPWPSRFVDDTMQREPEYHHGCTNRDRITKKITIAQCLSSFVVSTGIYLGIFFSISRSQFSIMQFEPLLKEHADTPSIWPSLLGLFAFMVFFCAVAIMILVGAPLSRMQKIMLIFWVIICNLKMLVTLDFSASSLNFVFWSRNFWC